eukprot:8003818-Pyramimonas_sp.AAC.1
MAKTFTTTTNGEATSQEAQVHEHSLPLPDAAAAIREPAGEAPGKAGSADSQRPSGNDMGGSRKSYISENREKKKR